MSQYFIRRVLLLFPILLAVYTITFVLMHATPGGPWDREKPIPPEVQANINKKYGLDRPLPEQYVNYLWGVVTRFDFGPSYKAQSRDVTDIIREQFPVSLWLGVAAMFLAAVVAIPIGIISALKQNSLIDNLAMFFAIAGVSVPAFVAGPILIWLLILVLKPQFGIDLGLPTSGWPRDWITLDIAHISFLILPKKPNAIWLPAITLALYPAALFARYTRSSMLEVIRMDYVRTARAKGLGEYLIVARHALRNALIPVVTVAGWLVAVIVTGSFYVETVFSVPGLGRYFVTSVTNRDYPVLLGVTLLFAAVIAVMNLIVDLLYGFLDPRISYK